MPRRNRRPLAARDYNAIAAALTLAPPPDPSRVLAHERALDRLRSLAAVALRIAREEAFARWRAAEESADA